MSYPGRSPSGQNTRVRHATQHINRLSSLRYMGADTKCRMKVRGARSESCWDLSNERAWTGKEKYRCGSSAFDSTKYR